MAIGHIDERDRRPPLPPPRPAIFPFGRNRLTVGLRRWDLQRPHLHVSFLWDRGPQFRFRWQGRLRLIVELGWYW